MTTPVDLLKTLHKLPLFEKLTAEELEPLAGSARLRRYPRGQVLFNRGDPTEGLVVVVSGRVQVVLRSPDGGQLVLVIIGAGGVLGEPSVVDGGPRSADAEALDDVELVTVPREPMMQLAQTSPAMGAALLEALSSSLRRLTDFTADLVFLELPRRAAKLLTTATLGRTGLVDLGMTQEQFAHRIGGTRQSVNTALRNFERRGWIEIDGRDVEILDPVALANYAGVDLSAS